MADQRSTTVSKMIQVPPSGWCTAAYLDRDAIAAWLPPGSMIGVVHAFDALARTDASACRLIYPESETSPAARPMRAPTRSRARFFKLVPDKEIVWRRCSTPTIRPFAGEMIVATTLKPAGRGTDSDDPLRQHPGGRPARRQRSRLPFDVGPARDVS